MQAAKSIHAINNDLSIEILTNEMLKQKELTSFIGGLIKNNNKNKKQTIKEFLYEIRTISDNKNLKEVDRNHRLESFITSISYEIRKTKQWIDNGDILTDSEKEFIKRKNIIKTLDTHIETLNELVYNKGDSGEVIKRILDFERDVLYVNDYIKGLKDNKEPDKLFEILNKHPIKAEYISSTPTELTVKEKDKDIERYTSLIKRLVKSGLPSTKEELLKIVQSKNTAITLKIETVHSIGMIGTAKDLMILTPYLEDNDPLIRDAAIKAITAILFGLHNDNRNISFKNYSNKEIK